MGQGFEGLPSSYIPKKKRARKRSWEIPEPVENNGSDHSDEQSVIAPRSEHPPMIEEETRTKPNSAKAEGLIFNLLSKDMQALLGALAKSCLDRNTRKTEPFTRTELAKSLKINPNSMPTLLARLRKYGWLMPFQKEDKVLGKSVTVSFYDYSLEQVKRSNGVPKKSVGKFHR